jgi:hypothetical protein
MSPLAHRVLWCALAFSTAALPLTLKADSIFNTFGPGHSYNCCSGWGESGSGIPSPDIVAMAFTPRVTSALGTIDVAIGWGGNVSKQYTLALMTDNGGLPGSILESWSVTSSFIAGECSTCFNSVFDKQHIVLQAGVQYWLVPFPSTGFNGGWLDNSAGSLGAVAESLNGGKTWSFTTAEPTLGAFDVKSTVPEPSTLILFGSGFLGIMGAARRKLRRRSFQSFPN